MPQLSIADAADLISSEAAPKGSGDLLGVEVEWHVLSCASPTRRVPIDEVLEATAPVLGGVSGSVTFEPGGQLEVSSRPARTATQVIRSTRADMDLLRSACSDIGLALQGSGMDPVRPPSLLHSSSRYSAMERYFAGRDTRSALWGRDMMCNTASVQVNVSMGSDSAGTRWQTAHDIGPMLVAAFASSPLRRGAPTGWKSTRQAAWAMLDPSRTRPADRYSSPQSAWASYALDAPVMFVREGAGYRALDGELRLRDWVERRRGGRPDPEDIRCHLTTLFPPVRPRGWLELRMIDMPPGDWWAAPVVLVDALVRDDDTAAAAQEICAPVRDSWVAAARRGLGDAALAEAARRCFELALVAAPDREAGEILSSYFDTFVDRERTPADAILDPAVGGVPR